MSRNYYEMISNESRLRYNKIKEEYNRHFENKKSTIISSSGYSKFELDEMSSELLIKIAEK